MNRDRDPDDARDMRMELREGAAADRREAARRRREQEWAEDLKHSDGPFAGPGERMAE